MKNLWLSFILALVTMSSVFAQNQNAIPGEYLIRFKNMSAAKAFYNRPGPRNIGKHEMLNVRFAPIAKVKVSDRDEAGRLGAALRSSTEILYVEPNYLYTLAPHQTRWDMAFNQNVGRYTKPTDEFFDKLWGLHNTKNAGLDINAINSWKVNKGNGQVIVAVIDTGVDYTHPDLGGNIWTNTKEIPGNNIDDDNNGFVDDVHGYDFANDDGDPMDDNSHGTHCAGTIGAAHNAHGVAGVMGNVSIMGIKFLTGGGSGSLADAVKAIDYATQMGAHVMSNSWGGGGYSKTMLEAIKRAEAKGIVFVAAAGNSSQDNDKRPMYPAGYESEASNVISVAAMDIDGKPASFTSYGAKTVHVSAPGVNILSTVPGGKYASYSGTSMATPHVSGVVGLVLSTRGIAMATKMREWLVKTSKPVDALKDISLSDGMVDSFAAISGQTSIFRQ